MVQDAGFGAEGIQVLRFRVWGSGSRVRVLGRGLEGAGFGV